MEDQIQPLAETDAPTEERALQGAGEATPSAEFEKERRGESHVVAMEAGWEPV